MHELNLIALQCRPEITHVCGDMGSIWQTLQATHIA